MAISNEEVLAELAAAFNTTQEFQAFISIAKPALSVVKLSNDLAVLKAELETSQNTLQDQILAKQVEFDGVIAQMKMARTTDLEQRKAAIASKQAEIDALNAQISS